MTGQATMNSDPREIARTFTELLSLELAALDLTLEHGITVPADQCALRSVLAVEKLRPSLLAAAAEATGVTVPLDQHPELSDLIALEIEWGNTRFSPGGSAIMTTLLGA
ncbi:MAG: hypothetical protein ACTHZ9_05910 [Leucobacter sp.]